MRTVTYAQTLNVPAAAAWAVFSDFGNFFEWNGLTEIPHEVVCDGIGMIRLMTVEGLGRIGERLDAMDHTARTQNYSLVEGEPLGMVTYQAEVRFAEIGAERCEIQWTGQFTGHDGADLDEMATNVSGSYAGMSTALETFTRAKS